VAEGVLWMRLSLRMRPDHVNVYALDDGDGWTVVDTGLDAPACRQAWARCWRVRWAAGGWGG
jgi:glyoxylase-like metal-dependent hydrolase (beta-lactamase superfamily II)